MSSNNHNVIAELESKFGDQANLYQQFTKDGITTIWIERNNLIPAIKIPEDTKSRCHSKCYMTSPVLMNGQEQTGLDQPDSDFTVVYHLTSFERNEDIRIKVPLKDKDLSIPSITTIWESANWYEREVYDMFGIDFNGHPRLYKNTYAKDLARSSFKKGTSGQGH